MSSPSQSPSSSPSESPSQSPSASPSASPSTAPDLRRFGMGPFADYPFADYLTAQAPEPSPSASPSESPSTSPSASASPSESPSGSPSTSPSESPSQSPSESPSASPSTPPWGDKRYWIGDGTSTDWSNVDNWTDDVVQEPGAPVPTSAEDVYFDDSGVGDCVLTANAECNSLIMDASLYTGQLDFAGFNMSISTDFRVANVKLGSGTHSVSGSLMGPSSGIGTLDFERCYMTVAGDIDLREASTLEGESTVKLVGSNNQYLYCGGSATSPNEFGELVVEKSGGLAVVEDNWSVANFIGNQGDFDLNGYTIRVGY